MLVKEWMATDVVTVDENASMMKATQIMKEHKIRRIPVVRRGKVVGIITDRDLKEAAPSKATSLDVHELYYLLSEIKVKDIMTPNPITIREDDTVERAAVIMLENRISGLPVVNDEGYVVGIITQTDVFKVLISITGIYRGPIQIAFDLEDRPGSINEVAAVIRQHGGRLVSILTSYDHAEPGRREVYIRIKDIEEEALKEMIERLKTRFKVLYVVRDDISSIPKKADVATKDVFGGIRQATA